MTSRRPWLIATGGAVLATVAVITAIALISGQSTQQANNPGLAGTTTPSQGVDPSETPPQSPTPGLSAHAVYYVGDTPSGPRLFREFQQAAGVNPLTVALALVTSPPDDPDYRTPWPANAFDSDISTLRGDVIQVELADASLHDRPADMTAAEADLAIEQVIYTVQAAFQDRLAVQFRFNGNPIDQVLGVSTSEALTNASPLATLSHASITDPAEGATVSGSFHAKGVGNSFEANLGWQIRQGDSVVASSSFTADGYQADRLFPWEGDVDVSGLAPGTYTFAVSEDDPSGGGDTDTDTRTIVIQ